MLVRRFALFLLLIGAMLGLAAQAPARELTPPMTAHAAVAMAAMSDCSETMATAPAKKACGCTRNDCIAAMLGAAPLFTVADADRAILTMTVSALQPQASATAPLSGRNVGPEPDPPNSLI